MSGSSAARASDTSAARMSPSPRVCSSASSSAARCSPGVIGTLLEERQLVKWPPVFRQHRPLLTRFPDTTINQIAAGLDITIACRLHETFHQLRQMADDLAF